MSLSRTKRLRAGWFVALVYLLCVLAPSMSFALPGGLAVALCLTDENHVPGMVHVHNQGIAQHVHADGHVHDHSVAHSHLSSGKNDRSISIVLNQKQVPEKAPNSSHGQCCGLTCVTALPATLVDIPKPSAPAAVCATESCREVAAGAPAAHYRPPIS